MRLYSTLTRQSEQLPAAPGPVGMYVCGPTVYQRIHVGNARPFVVFMWMRNWLREQGYEATLVENVTDINDKIYDAARRQGIPSDELARHATEWHREDTDDLGLGRPDARPLATETLDEIVALIEELVERGLAYESGGDVYFRVARFPEYGALSGAKVDEMVAQEEPSELKEDPRDFALWKATKPHEDTSWESPWGPGRPGWHIECSAMAEKYLGPGFELHAGGLDLRFPHHENEIAQSRGAGREFARVWAHNGMLELSGEKMSKSLGNIATLRDVLDEFGREAVLLFFLRAHYRSPISFSDDELRAARAEAEGFRDAFLSEREGVDGDAPEWEDFAAALDDDFNTPEVLAIMHAWQRAGRLDLLERALSLFGLGSLAQPEEAPDEVRELAEERQDARARRDFAEADRLRDEIERLGWEARDSADGFLLVRR